MPQRIPLNYQAPVANDTLKTQRRQRRLVIFFLSLRIFYWIIRIGLIVAVIIYAKRLVGTYNRFMPH